MPAQPQQIRLTSNRRYYRELGTIEIDGAPQKVILGDCNDIGSPLAKLAPPPVIVLPIDAVKELKRNLAGANRPGLTKQEVEDRIRRGAALWDACTTGDDPEFRCEAVGATPAL